LKYLLWISVFSGILLPEAPLAWAQQTPPVTSPLVLTDKKDVYTLGSQVDVLEDAGGALTIQDVLTGSAASRFQPHPSDSFNFGLGERVLWFRFHIRNESELGSEWMLEASNPRLNFVSFYLPRSESEIRVMHSGNSIPYFQWPVDFRNPTFHFRVRHDAEATVYLRVENNGALRFALTIFAEQAFNRHAMRIEIAWGVFYGALVSMILYNAVLMVSLRDRTYFYYFLLIVAFLLYQATMNGTAFQWLWPSQTWWADRSIGFFFGLTFFFGVLFSRSFLELRVHFPATDKVLTGLMVVCIAISAGSLGGHIVANAIAHVVAMVAPPYVMLIAAKRWAMGYTPARVMLLAWCALSASAVLTGLASFSLLPQTVLTEFTVPFGFTVALLLFALALADRIRMVEREYQAILSKTVEERTQELSFARQDIKVLSELLPICSSCKKIRDDKGYWNQLEGYLLKHADLEFSHGICPDCAKRLYPEHYREL